MRVGALTGENQKIRKHIEWSLNRTLSDMQKESLAKSSEDSGRIASALEGLYEGMDKFQEKNLREMGAQDGGSASGSNHREGSSGA